MKPKPVQVTLCKVCGLPWARHLLYARHREDQRVKLSDCVALLRSERTGPPGPQGAVGPMGPAGQSA